MPEPLQVGSSKIAFTSRHFESVGFTSRKLPSFAVTLRDWKLASESRESRLRESKAEGGTSVGGSSALKHSPQQSAALRIDLKRIDHSCGFNNTSALTKCGNQCV